jgi:hypothetical protein
LRTADHEAAYGVVPALGKIVAAIGKRCRQARIIVRGDSGFCREAILAWCEGQSEVYYCARGDMENLLKQQVLDLRADRMSPHHLASNQFRLSEAAFAYLLLERLRTQGLAGTELERATAGSLRLKRLKVAVQVRVSVRRVYVQLSSTYPLQELFRLCHRRLMRLALPSS